MDALAGLLCMCPVEFRRKNAIRPGNLSPTQVELSLSNVGNLEAVSYTHLDVYKRQVKNLPYCIFDFVDYLPFVQLFSTIGFFDTLEAVQIIWTASSEYP